MSEPSKSESVPARTPAGRVFRLLLRLLGLLPLPLVHALGAALGLLFTLVPNRTRRIARRNVELCFPGLEPAERQRLVRRTLVETGKGLAELGRFWTGSPDRALGLVRAVHGQAAFEACVASGDGFVLAAPHLGAWELLCLYLASRTRCTVLYREPRDPGIEAVINDGRSRLGTELVRASPAAVRRLYRALAEGRMLGILPDQQPKRGQDVFAPFFWRNALTMVLDLHFETLEEAASSRDVDASVAALNAAIERQVRRRPEQYQWGYKRFSIQPDGSSPY